MRGMAGSETGAEVTSGPPSRRVSTQCRRALETGEGSTPALSHTLVSFSVQSFHPPTHLLPSPSLSPPSLGSSSQVARQPGNRPQLRRCYPPSRHSAAAHMQQGSQVTNSSHSLSSCRHSLAASPDALPCRASTPRSARLPVCGPLLASVQTNWSPALQEARAAGGPAAAAPAAANAGACAPSTTGVDRAANEMAAAGGASCCE